MKRAIGAGALYFLLIFLLGMALGTIRVLPIEPRLGAVASVLVELPFMLAASWFVCGQLIRHLAVPPAFLSRAAMGGLAFLLDSASRSAHFASRSASMMAPDLRLPQPARRCFFRWSAY